MKFNYTYYGMDVKFTFRDMICFYTLRALTLVYTCFKCYVHLGNFHPQVDQPWKDVT